MRMFNAELHEFLHVAFCRRRLRPEGRARVADRWARCQAKLRGEPVVIRLVALADLRCWDRSWPTRSAGSGLSLVLPPARRPAGGCPRADVEVFIANRISLWHTL